MKKAGWRFARVTGRWLDQAGFTFMIVMIRNFLVLSLSGFAR